jgi:hypothetical protein
MRATISKSENAVHKKIIPVDSERLAPVDEVLDFVGASSCRIVYRRQRSTGMDLFQRRDERARGSSITIASYKRGADAPSVVDIDDTKAFAPLFSSDGAAVVYNETFRATGIFVLTLDTGRAVQVAFGANPHWWTDPKTREPYIVYRERNHMFEELPDGKTCRQRIDKNNMPQGEPEEIYSLGFGGGISPDGRYLYTGYLTYAYADLAEGRHEMPIGIGDRDTGKGQTCCVSAAPDNSHRSMQLRMPHTQFTVTDLDGSNEVSYVCPEGVEEWQTPEWSTRPNLATAAGMRPDGNYDIFLVRLSDHATLKLTLDGGYVHGHMWVGSE